jgi:hypothetical protein
MGDKAEAPIAVELEWRMLKPLKIHTDLLSILFSAPNDRDSTY